MIIQLMLCTIGLWSSNVFASDLQVGVSAVDITPYNFEQYPATTNHYKDGDPFYDTGVDQLFDFEEPGAFGKDGKPGIAGVDDDGDGIIDNCDRTKCTEYMAKGSDDVYDPNKDNYDAQTNPTGTENNGKFEFLHLGGFAPYVPTKDNRIANGVHDPIWARALVLKRDGETIVLVSADLPGFTWKHINPIRRRVEKDFGIPMSKIIIASTHDHHSPDAAGYWTTLLSDHNRGFTDPLKDKVYEAIKKALANIQPAQMKVITTYHDACMDVKTHELKKEAQCHFPVSEFDYDKHPGVYDPWIIQRDMRDPVVLNTKITAAQFINPQSGQTIATFVNWSDHPETFGSGNNLVSSDFPNYLRKFVEHKLGGVAVYFSGTVGCQIGALRSLPVPLWSADFQKIYDTKTDLKGNILPVFVTDGEPKVRSLGFEVGNEVVTALGKATGFSESSPFWIKTQSLDINVDNEVHERLTTSVWNDNVEEPDRMIHDHDRCQSPLGCVRTDISVLRIGDLSLVTTPGEMDPSYLYGRVASQVDYGGVWGVWRFPAQPGFEKYMPAKHQAVLGQAQNYLSYMIHRSDNVGWWNQHHPNYYEEEVTVGVDFGDDVGDRLMQMLGGPDMYVRSSDKNKKYPSLFSFPLFYFGHEDLLWIH